MENTCLGRSSTGGGREAFIPSVLEKEDERETGSSWLERTAALATFTSWSTRTLPPGP